MLRQCQEGHDQRFFRSPEGRTGPSASLSAAAKPKRFSPLQSQKYAVQIWQEQKALEIQAQTVYSSLAEEKLERWKGQRLLHARTVVTKFHSSSSKSFANSF